VDDPSLNAFLSFFNFLPSNFHATLPRLLLPPCTR